MGYTAAQVKDLRKETGAGFADCKKALDSTDGDMQQAREWLKTRGSAVAGKKAGRETGEGRIAFASSGKRGCLVEVLTETDFVANNEQLAAFAKTVAEALAAADGDVDDIGGIEADGATLEDARKEVIAKTGENVQFGRHRTVTATSGLHHYIHHNHRIGVIADVDQGTDDGLGADICMHVAAFHPSVMSPDDFPGDEIDGLRESFAKEVAEGGKDPAIQEKIVEGKLRKHTSERSLLKQPFIKDDKVPVEKHLKSCGAKVISFTSLVLGQQ